VANDIVSCKKCEKIIHQLGETHVERGRHHLQQKCTKPGKTRSIPACLPATLSLCRKDEFQSQFAFWFYSTEMAFHKAAHPSLGLAVTLLYSELWFQPPPPDSCRPRSSTNAAAT
jgi:hypothetical protein